MPTAGKNVITENGKRGLLASGKAAVFDANGNCIECCAPDYQIDAYIGDALKGDSRTESATQVAVGDRETTWRSLESNTVGVMVETDTLGELTLGRYAAGSYMDYDEDHVDMRFYSSYRTRVPLTFDTSVLSGLTVTRAVVRIEALAVVGAGVEDCVSEDFDFGLFEADETQHDGDRSTDVPDVPGFFEFELTDPDDLLNKSGDTILYLKFLSDVQAALPAAHTFADYAAFTPGGLAWSGWTYAQAWLMDSGLTGQVQLLVEAE